MAYQKQIWSNDPVEDTPLSAERLTHIENGVNQVNNIGELTLLETEAKDNLVNAINETNVKIDITSNESFAGYKIDGKNVYVKKINLDAMPNATSKTVSIGFGLENKIIKWEAIADNGAGTIFPLPYVDTENLNQAIEFRIGILSNIYNFVIYTGTNRSTMIGTAYVYYTKENE